jgi:hypothetical protein
MKSLAQIGAVRTGQHEESAGSQRPHNGAKDRLG